MEEKRISLSRWSLKYQRLSFLWPSKKNEFNSPGMAYYSVWVLLNLPLTGGSVAHLIRNLMIGRDLGRDEDLAMAIIIVNAYFITFNYARKQPQLASLLADLSDFSRFGKPDGIDKKKRVLDIIANIVFFYVFFGCPIYRFSKYKSARKCRKISAENGYKDEICGLVLNFWFPYIEIFNGSKILYYFLLAYQLASGIIFLKSALSTCYHLYEIVHFIMWRVDHLAIKIEECFAERNPQKKDRLFIAVIQYHWQILDFSKTLNRCFQNAMFSHIAFTASICGLLEYQIIKTDDKISGIIHLAGYIIAIFLACLAGQQFIDTHETLPLAIYNTKWYEGDVNFQKKVLFFLMRSQEIQVLKAGPFGILSYALFVSVLKLSYSILTVLTKQ